jgi:hypothetical protein
MRDPSQAHRAAGVLLVPCRGPWHFPNGPATLGELGLGTIRPLSQDQGGTVVLFRELCGKGREVFSDQAKQVTVAIVLAMSKAMEQGALLSGVTEIDVLRYERLVAKRSGIGQRLDARCLVFSSVSSSREIVSLANTVDALRIYCVTPS